MTLIGIAEMTEEQARKFVKEIRWPDGVVCPHCGSMDKMYPIKPNKETKVRAGLYKCGCCRKQFTVTTGTIMQGSHLPIKTWLMAFHLVCSSKKGISSLQIQRNLGIGSCKTSWFLVHRIRTAMKSKSFGGMLKGIVEIDETYIGGKSKEGKRGRGSERKVPVLTLVERNGKAISKPIENVSAKTLKPAIREFVDRSSRIMTDEWPAYDGIGLEFAGGHHVVSHGEGVYSCGDATVNSAESYFALLKRGVHGIFHHVSKQHLPRYCDEFSFRWSNRKVTDGERTVEAIKGIEGKRLKFREVIA